LQVLDYVEHSPIVIMVEDAGETVIVIPVTAQLEEVN
jgi:hypothetical protein